MVEDCEDYVNTDFIQDPDSVDCTAHYPTGTPVKPRPPVFPRAKILPNSIPGPASNYWCEYRTKWINPRCHRPFSDHYPACRPLVFGVCLKRASGMGGCDQVAQTIRCRGWQGAFDYNPGVTKISDVREQGCSPCQALPFTVLPTECQYEEDIPGYSYDNAQVRILQVQGDFAYGKTSVCGRIDDTSSQRYLYNQNEIDKAISCAHGANAGRFPVCDDPTRGRLEWTTDSIGQISYINSPVTITIKDLPLLQVYPGNYRYLNYADQTGPPHNKGDIWRGQDGTMHYIQDRAYPDADNPTIRRGSLPDPLQAYGGVSEMDISECQIQRHPSFRIGIQELWPDTAADYDAIEDLFGSDALIFWDDAARAGEEAELTKAHGLPVLSSPPTRAELDARTAVLYSEADCEHHAPRLERLGDVCIWTPARPGFFQLTGMGAWSVKRSNPRQWGINSNPNYYDGLRDHIADTSKRRGVTETACVLSLLWTGATLSGTRLGCETGTASHKDFALTLDSTGTPITPARAGLDAPGTQGSPLRGPLPQQSVSDDWLYTEDAVPMTLCDNADTRDFRVHCGDYYNSGNYTETEPVGIIVYELRVSTVLPY